MKAGLTPRRCDDFCSARLTPRRYDDFSSARLTPRHDLKPSLKPALELSRAAGPVPLPWWAIVRRTGPLGAVGSARFPPPPGEQRGSTGERVGQPKQSRV
ncbi:hypothetical protein ONA91_03455 [Micromonospora sp. DR5-3]|uniref:hypothetical protein n=1 Tax=unclassified Micromonospora TaxID=2617518 RepID=UPI0011DC5C61|nr:MULTISPECIES: hypothetical protein [unclassified Micromonospora]MCW3813517.1 hypothetical protein [Micromonospora sp. DR5-3]TYC24818.1 hypothetical protein FXF52_07860 [Micromonospora sp. MP36]